MIAKFGNIVGKKATSAKGPHRSNEMKTPLNRLKMFSLVQSLFLQY